MVQLSWFGLTGSGLHTKFHIVLWADRQWVTHQISHHALGWQAVGYTPNFTSCFGLTGSGLHTKFHIVLWADRQWVTHQISHRALGWQAVCYTPNDTNILGRCIKYTYIHFSVSNCRIFQTIKYTLTTHFYTSFGTHSYIKRSVL